MSKHGILTLVTVFACCTACFAADKKAAIQVAQGGKDEAAAVVGSSLPATVGISTEAAPPDLRSNQEKLFDPSPLVRRNAVIYLAGERARENVPYLIRMLDDPNIEVRRAAIYGISNAGDKSAAKQLMERYANEQELSVRTSIISALGTLKNPSAVPLLRKTLKDVYGPLRNDAIRSLADINSPAAYDDIVSMLNDDAEGTRIMAAQVSAELKLAPAIPLLEKNLTDPVPNVRLACVQALGTLASAADLQYIESLFKDKNAEVAAAAHAAADAVNARAAK